MQRRRLKYLCFALRCALKNVMRAREVNLKLRLSAGSIERAQGKPTKPTWIHLATFCSRCVLLCKLCKTCRARVTRFERPALLLGTPKPQKQPTKTQWTFTKLTQLVTTVPWTSVNCPMGRETRLPLECLRFGATATTHSFCSRSVFL